MQDPILLSTVDDAIASEKARLLSAQAIAHNPDQRKRVEAAFGMEYCKQRWPEVYSPQPFSRRIVDVLTFREFK